MTDIVRDPYGNPLNGDKLITTLRAENERLRAALEEIASGKYSGIVLTSYPPQDPAVNRARAALEEKQ